VAFCAKSDLEALIQTAIDEAHETAATRAITEATAIIQNYCQQTLELTEDDELTLDSRGGRRIVLPQRPVIEVASVVEDDEELTAEDDYRLGQHGILYRLGRDWARGVQIITVTYSHGYETIPEDIKAICARAAARVYQAGLRMAETEGVPGIASVGLGDYTVSYATREGTDGLLGISAAPVLLPSEKEVLDYYQ